MQKRIWKNYNRQLVERGSITFYIDEKCIETTSSATGRGRPQQFSNPLIQALLLIKSQYRLTYRALEGFAKSIIPLMNPSVCLPTYSLICKRAKALVSTLPKLSARRPEIVLIDATGLKVMGEGEWKVKIHGKSKRRRWIKIHVAMDEKSQEIVALEVSHGHVADCAIGPTLIRKCPKSTKVVIGDGGYDTKRCREAIQSKGAQDLIPPRRTATSRGDTNRDRAVRELKGLGGDLLGRSIWGKLTGYSRRALVETGFSRHKQLFGSGLYSRTQDRIRVEAHLKSYMMNKMLSAK
jgi:IS5 family transposase